MKKGFSIVIAICMLLASACERRGNDSDVAQDPVAIYSEKIERWTSRPEHAPHIRIVHDNISDHTMWTVDVQDGKAEYYWSDTSTGRSELAEAFEMPWFMDSNLYLLVKALNPSTLPYYYGDLVPDDPHLYVIIENDTILTDLDFSKSVVPSEIVQIYQYLNNIYTDLAIGTDKPAWNYGQYMR